MAAMKQGLNNCQWSAQQCSRHESQHSCSLQYSVLWRG